MNLQIVRIICQLCRSTIDVLAKNLTCPTRCNAENVEWVHGAHMVRYDQHGFAARDRIAREYDFGRCNALDHDNVQEVVQAGEERRDARLHWQGCASNSHAETIRAFE